MRSSRNVTILAVSLFGLALGEELWLTYMPAYLTALGASGVAVGLFGSLRDFLDSAYQYPGGWLADRFGRRVALLTFTIVATAGYVIYALAPTWPIVFLGLFGVMAWKSGAFPTTFAVIGDSLPKNRRAVAFSVQSILIRLPRVIGAPLGGLLIVSAGMAGGIRTSLVITIGLALIVLIVQFFGFREEGPAQADGQDTNFRAVLAGMPTALTRLLTAECLIRIGEAVAASFIILYVTEERHVSAAAFGVLYAVQQSVSIASYFPGGRMADLSGRRPIVALTFVFFATFPLAVRFAPTFPWLVAAFVLGGLKEIGEPARKSLIVDLSPDDRRARTVGVYYTIRNLLVVPAGALGGLLWQQARHLPLEVACAIGAVGVIVFLVTPYDRTSDIR